MKVLKYKVNIEFGINRTLKNFENEIKDILTDKRGFPIIFVQDQFNYDFEINLSKPKTIQHTCNFKGLSCADMSNNKIYINNSRWINGSKASRLSLKNYRKYAIYHETGHILGLGHDKPIDNQLVPIMVQATLNIGKAKPNCYPLKREIEVINKMWNA